MTRRFELDVASERQLALLRIGAGALALVASAWLAMVSEHAWLRILLPVSAIFAVFWAISASRGGARSRTPGDWYLELTGTALTLCEAGQRTDLPWKDIKAVEIDHDRLRILVHRASGEPLPVESRYRGVGLDALAQAIEDARRAQAPADD